MLKRRLAVFFTGLLAGAHGMAASQCYGTVANGRLEHAARLPDSGANFSAYSAIAAAAGRTHVHSTVADIVLASYGELAGVMPAARFVYGETGLAAGGAFPLPEGQAQLHEGQAVGAPRRALPCRFRNTLQTKG